MMEGFDSYKAVDSMFRLGSLRFIKEGSGLFAEIPCSRVISGSGNV
jgi:hypothetical protein